MKNRFAITLILSLITASTICYSQPHKDIYSCKPCGLACDSLTFDKPGQCPHCNMKLITKEELHKSENLVLNEIKFEEGSGEFMMEGGMGHKEKVTRVFYHKPVDIPEDGHHEKVNNEQISFSINKSIIEEIVIKDGTGSFLFPGGNSREGKIIRVHYYKPKKYQADFKVILVIPGGGRNGDTYRDSWIDLAEKYDLLILSPTYSEEFYPGHITYNLSGMVKDYHNIKLDALEFTDSEEWLFHDFDRIFDAAVASLGSTEKKYDIFGHSAGGQIVHRLILFHPEGKYNHAMAANSGWYTIPDFNQKFPYGLKNSPVSETGLDVSLQKNLIVFIGELDNENEKRGHLRTTPESMTQGAHRFERGTYFFEKTIKESQRLGLEISWKKKVVKGVGHSYNEMGRATAEHLYGGSLK